MNDGIFEILFSEQHKFIMYEILNIFLLNYLYTRLFFC